VQATDLPPTDLLLVGKDAWMNLQAEHVRRQAMTWNEIHSLPILDAPWTAVIRALLVGYDITPKSGTACESAKP